MVDITPPHKHLHAAGKNVPLLMSQNRIGVGEQSSTTAFCKISDNAIVQTQHLTNGVSCCSSQKSNCDTSSGTGTPAEKFWPAPANHSAIKAVENLEINANNVVCNNGEEAEGEKSDGDCFLDVNLNKRHKKSVTFEEADGNTEVDESFYSYSAPKYRAKNERAQTENLPGVAARSFSLMNEGLIHSADSNPNFYFTDLNSCDQHFDTPETSSAFENSTFSPVSASTPSSANERTTFSEMTNQHLLSSTNQQSTFADVAKHSVSLFDAPNRPSTARDLATMREEAEFEFPPLRDEKRAFSFTGGPPAGPSCLALRSAVLALYRLDDFDREYLSEGFFSDVYKVKHKTTGEVMVLKINKPETSQKANIIKEVQLMNRLRHPNVVQFKGVCVDQGNLHALTEFCNAGSLERLILNEERKFSWRLRASLALDIARGMEYAHASGFMHRDLTAMNILLKRTGYAIRAVLADFGLSCKIPDKNSGKKLEQVGTPYWMAPECLKEEQYDEKSDVFSYGVICCQMIARIDADPDKGFPRTSVFGLDYVLFGDICPEDTPEELLLLAFQCCAIDPKSRPGFDMLVKRALIVHRGIQGQIRSKSKPWSHADSPGDILRISRSFSDAGLSAALTRISSERNKAKTVGNKSLVNSAMDSEKSSEKSREAPNGESSTPVADRKTSRILARSVAEKDPFYEPGHEQINPFAEHEKFRDGRKIPLPKTPDKLWGSVSFDDDHSHSVVDSPDGAEARPDFGLRTPLSTGIENLTTPPFRKLSANFLEDKDSESTCEIVGKIVERRSEERALMNKSRRKATYFRRRANSLPNSLIRRKSDPDQKKTEKCRMSEVFRDKDSKFASLHYPTRRHTVWSDASESTPKSTENDESRAAKTSKNGAETSENCVEIRVDTSEEIEADRLKKSITESQVIKIRSCCGEEIAAKAIEAPLSGKSAAEPIIDLEATVSYNNAELSRDSDPSANDNAINKDFDVPDTGNLEVETPVTVELEGILKKSSANGEISNNSRPLKETRVKFVDKEGSKGCTRNKCAVL